MYAVTKLPRVYVMKTLLGGKPDVNRRFLYVDDKVVRTFNYEMRPWTKELQAELEWAAESECRKLSQTPPEGTKQRT
jgi:hypothetical protein